MVALSLCCASLVSVPTSAAAACQAGAAGCVLPVGRVVAPPPPPAEAPPPIIEEEHHGIGWLPIILGLAALGALVWLLVDDNNDNPVSP